ncbi:MAG TPA: hypothetical protein VIU11_25850 [Nakamurella sp.]
MLYSRLTADAATVRVTCRPAGTGTRPRSVITAYFPVPLAARTLLQASREFARAVLANPGRRLFTPAAMSTERIAAAAVNSGRRLPDRPDLDRPASMRQE